MAGRRSAYGRGCVWLRSLNEAPPRRVLMDAGDRVDGKVTGQEEVLGRLIGTRYGRVVGAQRDGDPGVEEDQDRVPSSARHGAGLVVRGQAALEHDLVAGQPPDELLVAD